MQSKRSIEFADIQALARFGHGHLKESQFLLLHIKNRGRAGEWLRLQQFNSAQHSQTVPDTALQIAFTCAGMDTLGLPTDVLAQFSEEFISGMSGDESRSRRLGDIGQSAPENWQWGHSDRQTIHVLLLLYARSEGFDEFLQRVKSDHFNDAFHILHTLPTSTLEPVEPFGFVDGISQPAIDWEQDQRSDVHARETYSNLLAPGEIVLGYANEYGQLTGRPLIDAGVSTENATLPQAHDKPSSLDLGANGCYLIIRQLQQDVAGFWQFIHDQSDGDAAAGEQLAAAMVGRRKNGEPLTPPSKQPIPGISTSNTHNHFNFDDDPQGLQCPVSSHIRRSNPRSADFAPGVTGLPSRLLRMLGFGRKSEYEDLVASSRFHRILRRGRTYTHPDTKTETGLQFVCLAGNILRQFEFIQSAWSISSSFAGMREQQDPLLGHRQARVNKLRTDAFMQADQRGAQRKTYSLPEFVTVRGGGYFFMPGLRAISYLGELAVQERIE